MKHHVSKRRQPWLRTAVYTFMTLTVTVIVALLTLVVLGYSFNQNDGRLEQGGLLQFSSVPTGASVTLDERVIGSKTNTKATVDAGSHSVSFDLDGYRTWRKTIDIRAGQIGWLNYARMIPTKVTPQTIRTFPALSGSLASPKHNYMLLHEAVDQPVFVLSNIQGDTVRYSTLTLPTTSYTAPTAGKTQSFSLDSWSQDESAVLVKHVYDDTQTEWLLLDRNSPEKSINLSLTFGITPSKIVFAGNGNRLLFVQTDEIVRRINLDEQTLSRPLASRVEQFTGFDDKTIVYTTTADAAGKRTVGYAATDIPQPQTIHTYPADGLPLRAAMETYFNDRYLSVVHGQTLKIESGTLPAPNTKANLRTVATQQIPTGIGQFSMTQNGRFVVMGLPDGYATYDLELSKYDKTNWAYPSVLPQTITWLDDYIIWSANGGNLRIYDFDGANQQNIMPVTEGYSASISSNDKYIYGILKTDKGVELRRAQLVK